MQVQTLLQAQLVVSATEADGTSIDATGASDACLLSSEDTTHGMFPVWHLKRVPSGIRLTYCNGVPRCSASGSSGRAVLL